MLKSIVKVHQQCLDKYRIILVISDEDEKI